MTKRFGAAVAVAAALAAAGCGSTSARVTGEVTLDGQPVTSGYVTFTPADGLGPDAGAPVQNGKFTISGLTPGPKVVKVIATKKVNFASTSEEMMQKGRAARRNRDYDGLADPADLIPASADGNNVVVELKPGANQQALHLRSSAGLARR